MEHRSCAPAGFTLIESLISLAIAGVIGWLVFSAIGRQTLSQTQAAENWYAYSAAESISDVIGSLDEDSLAKTLYSEAVLGAAASSWCDPAVYTACLDDGHSKWLLWWRQVGGFTQIRVLIALKDEQRAFLYPGPIPSPLPSDLSRFTQTIITRVTFNLGTTPRTVEWTKYVTK